MNEVEIVQLIKESLIKVAPRRAVEFSKIQAGASLEALALESITTLELVTALEARLGLVFSDEDLLTIQSVAELAALIRRMTPA